MGSEGTRQPKSNSAGFSIGFAAETRRRKGGGRVLVEIDLLEISATSTPANATTRALDWKSADRKPWEWAEYWTGFLNDVFEHEGSPEPEPAVIGRKSSAPIRVASFEC